MRITIACATSSDATEWNQFVDQQKEARFADLWEYRHALEQSYGLTCVYRRVLADRKLIGVFSSVVDQRRRRLLSQPFIEYGGPLCPSLTPPDADHLIQSLLHACGETSCDHIFIRGGLGLGCLAASANCRSEVIQEYGEISLEPATDPWTKIDRRARSNIKQATKAGLRCEIRTGQDAVSGEFYKLYLRSMLRHASPPHPLHYFMNLAEAFQERMIAAWVFHGNKAASVLLAGATAQRLHTFITASDDHLWHLRPNDLATWGLLSWAHQREFRYFDFGAAASREHLQYKQKWGANMQPYALLTLRAAQSEAEGPLKRSSHLGALGKAAWGYLPLQATALLGPILRAQRL